MNDAYPDLVRQATLAASSHNTQPWKFRLLANGMDILPDFSRRLPVVDPDDHHLFASLGCAAENLLHASAAVGLQGYFSCSPGEPGAHIHFERSAPSQSPLFEAIPHRQCCRSDYDGSVMAGDQLRLLEDAAQGTGVSLLWLTGSSALEAVAEYVAQGNDTQLCDPAWREELKDWVRFSAAEARRTGDGLYGPVMGNPSVPRWLGSLAMRLTLSARSQNDKDSKHIRHSSAVAVFFSEADDWQHWIEVGRSYERFALQATALGLVTAFINQPVEVPALRSQFAAYLGISGRRPDLVVRVGRGPAMPRSMRRPVEEVIEAAFR
ncbi:Tat pathway signal protein [Arenimonas soli]|uniref:Tat pathway signal protein n=1 Tax=Arenimonas soli TaxID=2269504 RepID=A0ABQ1HU24_9GAMM|nr:Tat pathway signal protein [Arenimonas soli]GGA87615.1 Tat pathway signal protein [Arenimonas soli]